MTELTNPRLCPECNRPVYGRSDKKFCSDACRNAYNNRGNSDAVNFVRNINNTLRKNRRILLEMNPTGKTKVAKSRLLQKGFDFEYHTSIYTTKSGQQYHYCYDQGYLLLEDDYVLLIVKKEFA